MVTNYTITATKANRLYWLGRYVERAYISLHLLRRYYDRMIDGDPKDYQEYYSKLDIINNNQLSDEAFRMAQLYDPQNSSSIRSCLEAAMDNGIVLREEIKSESLAYVEMSLSHLKKCAAKQESNITELQPVTDYLLAFFGSIEERVFEQRIRNFIIMGKLVENIDLHIRFDYPFYRIKEAYESLKRCADIEDHIFDHTISQRLEELLKPDLYEAKEGGYRNTLLQYLNHWVLL